MIAKPQKRCMFCNRPIPETEIICEREDCQENDRELGKAIGWMQRQEFILGFQAALKQRAKADEEWELNRLQRWFYTVKLVLCIVCRLRYSGEETFPDAVEVAYYSLEPAGWFDSFRMIQVGYGYFSGWWWEIEVP